MLSLSRFIALLKINFAKRKRFFYFPFTRKVLQFLIFLKQELIISGFTISSNVPNYFTIYLKYHKYNPVFSSFVVNAKKKIFFTFTLVEIRKFQVKKKSNFFPLLILENGLGFLSDNRAKLVNHGGRFVGILK